MEVLRNNEEKVMCPYNASHYIRKYRMDVHLKKCRNAYKESEIIVICDFNSAHRVPQPELQYHHDICPDRKNVELHVFSEESLTPSTGFTLPPVPVPVDGTWDDDEVPSYNPEKYCSENNILRRIDTEPAAIRRDFRISERHRHSNLATGKGGVKPDLTQNAISRSLTRTNDNSQNLPPTPRFSQRNVEGAPVEITKMMEQVSIIPKTAVIPKQK